MNDEYVSRVTFKMIVQLCYYIENIEFSLGELLVA